MTEAINTPNELIRRVFDAIDEGLPECLPGKRPKYRLTLPAAEEIDHTRFTRGYLNFNGMDVTISIFSGHDSVEREVPEFDISKPPTGQEIPLALVVLDNFAEGKGPFTAEDARRMAADIRSTFLVLSKPARVVEELVVQTLKVSTDGPATFKTDYRIENPKLHALYRGYALETILICQNCTNTLYGMSRWPASDMAHLLWERVNREIVEDAAWFEAAALIAMKIDLTPYLPEHSTEEVQEAVMRAQES